MATNLDINARREWMPAYAITLLVVTTVLLSIRLISRFNRLGGGLGLDDVFIVLGWASAVAFTFLVIYMCIHLGFDRHFSAVPVNIWPIGAKWTYVTEFVVMWGGLFTKLSVLLFYRRLVAGTASLRFKIAIWTAMAFVVAYTITFTTTTLLDCHPISQYWEKYDVVWLAEHAAELHCSSTEQDFIIATLVGSLSVFTDWYSVMLPAVLLLRIRMNRNQKYGLLFIFGLGYTVVAAGIVRTYYLGQAIIQTDKPWITFNVEATSLAEINIAIICACAPSLKTVTGRFFQDLVSKTSSKTTGSHSSGPNKRLSSYNSTVRSSKSSVGNSFTRRFRRTSKGKELGSFAEAHEYGLQDFGPVPQGYEEKSSKHLDSQTSKLPDITEDDIESQLGQAVPLEPQPLLPHYDGDPIPSATIIIRPQQTGPRQASTPPLSTTGRNAKTLTAGQDPRVPLSPIPSAAPSIVFINNEEDTEEFVRVRYHSLLGTNTSDEDQHQELSFPRMNPEITRSQSMRDYRDFGTLPESLTTAGIGRSQGTQTLPRETVVPGSIELPQSEDKVPEKEPEKVPERGSVRNALQGIRMSDSQRWSSKPQPPERIYEHDSSRLESPSSSEVSLNEDDNEERINTTKASKGQTAIVGRASLTDIPSPSRKASKAASARATSPVTTSLPVVALNTANRVFSPFPPPLSSLPGPRRPGTAPTAGSAANISKPLVPRPESFSSPDHAIGLSTSITQSSEPRSPNTDPSDLSKYIPQSFVSTGVSNSGPPTPAAASASSAANSGRVSPLFSRGRKPSRGGAKADASTIAAAAVISGGPSSAVPGTAVGLQSTNPFLRPGGFGVVSAASQHQNSSPFKYRFTPKTEGSTSPERKRASSEDPKGDKTWMDDQSTGSSQSGSGISRAKVRPIRR